MHKCIIAKCIHYVLIDCWEKISVVAQVKFDPEKVVEMHVNLKLGNEGWLRFLVLKFKKVINRACVLNFDLKVYKMTLMSSKTLNLKI